MAAFHSCGMLVLLSHMNSARLMWYSNMGDKNEVWQGTPARMVLKTLDKFFAPSEGPSR
jgi:hypothetical protein